MCCRNWEGALFLTLSIAIYTSLIGVPVFNSNSLQTYHFFSTFLFSSVCVFSDIMASSTRASSHAPKRLCHFYTEEENNYVASLLAKSTYLTEEQYDEMEVRFGVSRNALKVRTFDVRMIVSDVSVCLQKKVCLLKRKIQKDGESHVLSSATINNEESETSLSRTNTFLNFICMEDAAVLKRQMLSSLRPRSWVNDTHLAEILRQDQLSALTGFGRYNGEQLLDIRFIYISLYSVE